MNFYKKRNKKSNLTKKEIATKLNTSIEKIEKLENGELEIQGDTFKKYVDATNVSKAEFNLEYAKLKEWYNKTDLKQLRFDFGYKNQTEFCKVCGISQSTYSMMETKSTLTPSYTNLVTIYNFFNNDFNKNANFDYRTLKQSKESRGRRFESKEDKKEELENNLYILDLDWKSIIFNSGKTQKQIAKEMNTTNINDKEPIKVNVDNTSKIIEEESRFELDTRIPENYGTTIQVKEDEQRMTMSELLECINNIDEVKKLKEENEILKKKIIRYEKIFDKLLD